MTWISKIKNKNKKHSTRNALSSLDSMPQGVTLDSSGESFANTGNNNLGFNILTVE